MVTLACSAQGERPLSSESDTLLLQHQPS